MFFLFVSWLWFRYFIIAVTLFIATDGGGVAVDMYARTHDPISYISPERAQAALSNLPVPVGMFMNMAHVPPRFYNQHQQALQGKHLVQCCMWVSLRCVLNVLKNKCSQDVLWNTSHNCSTVSYDVFALSKRMFCNCHHLIVEGLFPNMQTAIFWLALPLSSEIVWMNTVLEWDHVIQILQSERSKEVCLCAPPHTHIHKITPPLVPKILTLSAHSSTLTQWTLLCRSDLYLSCNWFCPNFQA